jgi:putative spermidine/putrescine transport system substrate-binding protein
MKFKPAVFAVACVVAMSALVACSGGSSSKTPTTFTFAGVGGASEAAYLTACVDPFAKAHNLKPQSVTNSSLAQLQLMEKTHKVTWDIAYDAIDGPGAGDWSSVLTPIDYSIVDKNAMIPAYRSYATKFGVAHDIYVTAIVYNTKTFASDPPQTWQDFFNTTKFPGKRAFASVAYNGPVGMTSELMLAAGKPGTPVDDTTAIGVLNSAKSDIVTYSSQTQDQQYLTSGRVVLASMVASNAETLIKQGAPVAIQWNQATGGADFLEVPKGAPNTKLSMEFIQFCNSTQPQIAFTKLHPNGPIDAAAAKELPADLANLVPTSPEHQSQIVLDDPSYWTPAKIDSATKALEAWEVGS